MASTQLSNKSFGGGGRGSALSTTTTYANVGTFTSRHLTRLRASLYSTVSNYRPRRTVSIIEPFLELLGGHTCRIKRLALGL